MNSETAKDIIEAIQWTASEKDGIAYKQLALAVLSGSVRDYGGKQLPTFSAISELLGVPKETLHNWWQDYDDIMDGKSDALLDHLEGILKEKVKIGLLISTGEILTRLEDPETLEEMPLKELLSLKKTLFTDDRILNGKPTSIKGSIRAFMPRGARTQRKLPAGAGREIEQGK